MNRNDLSDEIRKQIENEEKAAKKLFESGQKTKNYITSLFFKQIALDSMKHAEMLRTILSLIESFEKRDIAEKEDFIESLDRHIVMERKMLQDFEDMIELTGDTKIRFMLQNIIADEKRHNKIMKRMHEIVFSDVKDEDERWWDFLYRFSRLTS